MSGAELYQPLVTQAEPVPQVEPEASSPISVPVSPPVSTPIEAKPSTAIQPQEEQPQVAEMPRADQLLRNPYLVVLTGWITGWLFALLLAQVTNLFYFLLLVWALAGFTTGQILSRENPA